MEICHDIICYRLHNFPYIIVYNPLHANTVHILNPSYFFIYIVILSFKYGKSIKISTKSKIETNGPSTWRPALSPFGRWPKNVIGKESYKQIRGAKDRWIRKKRQQTDYIQSWPLCNPWCIWSLYSLRL